MAADVVWLDALVTNVDRTPRNPNLLVWHGRLWLIDHGAALYWHHATGGWPRTHAGPSRSIADHVLLPAAGSILEADARLARRLDAAARAAVVSLVPDEWLEVAGEDGSAEERRQAYLDYLTGRLEEPRAFAEEAEHARAA